MGTARIPKARYTSKAFMALEWEHIWTRQWLLAGRSADVASPGEFFLFEIGHESIIVTRASDGALRAAYNVCQHRGTRLVRAPRGRTDCFRCPYHGWEYHLDGRLKRLTDAAGFAGIRPTELALVPLACAEWGGFVWVSMNLDAPPLEASLGSLADTLAPYELERHSLLRDVTIEWDCNWKVAMDNSNETYHIQSIHPQLLDLVDDLETAPEVHGDHSCFFVRMGTPSPRLRDGLAEIPPELARYLGKFGVEAASLEDPVEDAQRAIQRALRARLVADGIDYPGLRDDQLTTNYHVHVFPHVMFNIVLPGFWLFRVRPHPSDPQRMFFDFQEYERLPADRAPRERPAHEHYRHGEVSLDAVLDQDAEIMPWVQRGLRSRACPPLLFGEHESRLTHMHEVIERLIYGAAGRGRDLVDE